MSQTIAIAMRWLFWVAIVLLTFDTQAWTLFPVRVSSSTDYDLVIVGAGASGLFASGAATMLGSRVLLVEQEALPLASYPKTNYNNIYNNIGGDCTNAACVPSKAIRSVARMATNQNRTSLVQLARNHATQTVTAVRNREDPSAMVERNPNLEIAIVADCQFISPHGLSLTVEQFFSSKNETRFAASKNIIRSKKFIIATGSSPIIPVPLQRSAQAVGLPIYTYQTLLRPSSDEVNPNSIWNFDTTKRIVIVGGGATACELGQSLARLVQCELDLVAPTLLRGDDATLANAAAQLLMQDGINLHLGRRVEEVLGDRSIRLSDDSILPPCDALVVCTGRSPALSLERLQLHKANIQWNEKVGVLVSDKNLQSISAPNVYACGDCCSAMRPLARSATHAAWMGYHAAIQTRLPRFLTLGAKMVHTTVPRVIYTDPELVSVGLSLEECVAKYGVDGFDRLNVPTSESDRSDMERLERTDLGFVELRANKVDAKLLGLTACGPAASELANEMSVILENKLSAMDVARSLHSYPSYGYMFHRVALSIALSSIWGSLEASGTLGRCVAWIGEKVCKVKWAFQNLRRSSVHKTWEAEGALMRIHQARDSKLEVRSFWDTYNQKPLDCLGNERLVQDGYQSKDVEAFQSWLSRRPY